MRRGQRHCQYGVLGIECGRDAVTTRDRPDDRKGRWAVCQNHAEFLDRLRANVAKHKPLLDRLAEGPEQSAPESEDE